MTLAEALAGKEIPEEIRGNLALTDVPYLSFGGIEKIGQLVVHEILVEDVKYLFNALLERQFPIEKIVPIVAYDWDDDASMADNNTSAFNYRKIYRADRLSNHSYGRAIDINPLLNPYEGRDGSVVPPGATYDTNVPGTVTEDIAAIFKLRGWAWGGDWTSVKDWQHFEKLT